MPFYFKKAKFLWNIIRIFLNNIDVFEKIIKNNIIRFFPKILFTKISRFLIKKSSHHSRISEVEECVSKCMHWQVSHDHKKKSGLKIDNHIWKRNVTSKKLDPTKKIKKQIWKKEVPKLKKKIGKKKITTKSEKKQNFKRSENLMENKIKKMCYRKKREKIT